MPLSNVAPALREKIRGNLMYTLYWSPGSASMAPHGVLEESGAKFELKLTSVDAGATRDPDYLKLNPNGKVPTLVVDGSYVLFESAAIAAFIADRHPQAKLHLYGKKEPRVGRKMGHLTALGGGPGHGLRRGALRTVADGRTPAHLALS